MIRMLLLSSGLVAIEKFINTELKTQRLLFIPTAGNPYGETWWVDKDRHVLQDLGFRINEFDIEGKNKTTLEESIGNTDIVYIAGGNTFYLLQQLQTTGFDKLLKQHVLNGGLYAGASAGAIIMGPEIEFARQFDDPEYKFKLDTTAGLGLTDFVPFPHYDMGQRQTIIDDIIQNTKHNIVPISDDQAILVERGSYKIIASPRLEVELNWPTNP